MVYLGGGDRECSIVIHEPRLTTRPSTSCRIAFGDSYTFNQGTYGYPGYSFIGDYRPGHLEFSPEQLLTNKLHQNFSGTSAGGPNWVQYLSECAVEKGEWLPAFCDMQLWNFAFAGADYSEEFLPPHGVYTTPMINQTQQYLDYAEPVIGDQIDKDKSLVAIWIGINDLGDAVAENKTIPNIYEDIIEAMFRESVSLLYQKNYRNILLVNQPPRDRGPSYVNDPEGAKTVKKQAAAWNKYLDKYAKKFAKQHPAANVMVYDAQKFLNKVLDHPKSYGISNTTTTCSGYNNATVVDDPGAFGCAPIETYFWFNAGHM